MSTKSAVGSSHFGDFQPEELLGQLKAEQLSRNYDVAAKFIEAVLGLHVDASRLNEGLRDGVILCRLINALRPGAVKRINTKALPFTQMENISNFLAAAQKLGLDSADLFQTVDLYEGKNMPRVVMTLLTIARVVAGIPLHSQRKQADLHKSLSDGWNSTTLTSYATTSAKNSRPELKTMHNQKTLAIVNGSREDALASDQSAIGSENDLMVHNGVDPRTDLSISSSPSLSQQHEHRRSKRRSATTLFIASSTKERSLQPEAQVRDSMHIAADIGQESGHNCLPAFSEDDSLILSGSPVLPTSSSTCSSRIEEDASNANDPGNLNESLNTALPDELHGHDPETSEDATLPRPHKHPNTKNKPKERLTVYSESAQRLTNYQLGNCIGRGQFGSVYRALDLETGQMVAVKQISIEGQDKSSMDDVMQEVELLKSLSSPRIVRYYGFVKTDAHLNLVMEFVENGSLSATLKSFGSFPEKLVLAYTVKIIEGLIYLHGRDVVHCDLKACNILTTKNGNTKLTDFGVSLNLKLRKPDDESVVAGTPYWMAPEIIQLEGACMASDIWSLGCTIIELLTGKPPYSGMMQMAALYRIVEDDHPPIPEGISEELKDFLLQCFKKDPKARPTATELMSHGWMAQYRRNRKEMKMLRRTCSRKMSTFMAHKKVEYNYPDFDPAVLKQLPLQKEQEESNGTGIADDGSKDDNNCNVDYTKATKQESLCNATASHSGEDTSTKIASSLISERCLNTDDANSESFGRGSHSKLSLDQVGDNASMLSDEDTDTSISTFEGPRVKHHRLRTILCDVHSICAICSKALSGAFIQCSSCKIRCHDACTQNLQPCTSMRMSRFLYPASRKSSKRYESKTPNIRLRGGRKNAIRRQHPSQNSLPSASFGDLALNDTYSSRFNSIIGSSDGSLHMSQAQMCEPGASKDNVVNAGFDGVLLPSMLACRPVSIAVTNGISETRGYHALGEMTPPNREFSFSRTVGEACDSGWETDDPEPHDVCSLGDILPNGKMAKYEQLTHFKQPASQPGPQIAAPQSVAKISIPVSLQHGGRGSLSAPLANSELVSGTSNSIGSRVFVQQKHQHQHQQANSQPIYYQPLANGANNAPVPPSPDAHLTNAFTQPISRPRPKSIRRMRANTASLDCLVGSAQLYNGSDGQERRGVSTFLRRRQHPLRSATSTELKAVAGFSPGAAQRVKRTHHGSNASISDLQSCTTSEMLYSRSDFGEFSRRSSGLQCFSMHGRTESSKTHAKRTSRGDCIVM
ncbi:Protein kinase of the Mitotic Exit Network [Coemansia sp. RSA 1200]|nr:Protein kinase of the Mitotic Exit Network [Coemansia sp. RSA 1200]